jgi:hypothetical protein
MVFKPDPFESYATIYLLYFHYLDLIMEKTTLSYKPPFKNLTFSSKLILSSL